MSERTYSRDEVQEILRLAIEGEAGRESGMDRRELVAAAAELGLTSEAIDGAIVALDRRQPVELEVQRIRAKRWRSLTGHLVTYVMVNTALFLIDWLTGGGWWFFWPALGWGLGVAMQAKGVLMADLERDRERAAKRLEKRRQKELRESRKALRRDAVEELLDTVVTQVSQAIKPSDDPRRR